MPDDAGTSLLSRRYAGVSDLTEKEREKRNVGAMPLGSGSVPFGTSHSNRSHARIRTRATARAYTRTPVRRRISAPITKDILTDVFLGAGILRKRSFHFFEARHRRADLHFEHRCSSVCARAVLLRRPPSDQRAILLCKEVRLGFVSHSASWRARRDLKL